MRLSCPACNAEMTLDVVIGHAGAREAVLAAMRLPAPLGKLVVWYAHCFRPAKRQLSFDRLEKLLVELVEMIEAAQVTYDGRLWAAPLESWKAALEEMQGRSLTLPLKNHNYLLSVLSGMANKAEAGAERKKEAARAGHTPTAVHASHQPAALPATEERGGMSEEARAAFERAKALTKAKRGNSEPEQGA